MNSAVLDRVLDDLRVNVLPNDENFNTAAPSMAAGLGPASDGDTG
jgi:hypothetical protein